MAGGLVAKVEALVPQVAAEPRLVRVAPDGHRLAYALDDGVYVTDAAGDGASELVASTAAPFRAEELAWSGDGAHLAFLLGSADPVETRRHVAWAKAAPGAVRGAELGRAEGAAFAWCSRGPGDGAVIVADPAARALRRHPLAGKPERLAELADDGSRDLPPRVVASADGQRVAFTCARMFDDLSEAWVVTRDGAAASAALLTQIPGAQVHVLPFWSPKGVTIGLEMVHVTLARSGMILIPRMAGEGEILHEREGLDAAVLPAWSPSGRFVAFFPDTDLGGPRLALLDPRSRKLVVLDEVGSLRGSLRFLADGRLAVDGKDRSSLVSFTSPV